MLHNRSCIVSSCKTDWCQWLNWFVGYDPVWAMKARISEGAGVGIVRTRSAGLAYKSSSGLSHSKYVPVEQNVLYR